MEQICKIIAYLVIFLSKKYEIRCFFCPFVNFSLTCTEAKICLKSSDISP
jgi:hypothetical protein